MWRRMYLEIPLPDGRGSLKHCNETLHLFWKCSKDHLYSNRAYGTLIKYF